MPHGQRDWSNIGADETVHGLTDVGELAARLGSPVTFNREGNVLMLEMFEHGLGHWSPAVTGTTTIEIVAEWARFGGYSLKFAVEADSNRYGLIDTSLPYPVKSNYGLEFSLRLNEYIDEIDVGFQFYDGTEYQWYEFYAYPNAKKILLQDRAAGFVTVVDPWVVRTADYNWQTFKLVADLTNEYYRRLIVNSTEYDLAAYRPPVTASAVAPYVFLRLQFYGSDSGAGVAYLDDVIFTQNEP